MNPELCILGFVVKATIKGMITPQPISQRFASRSAAECFCELAKKNGYVDAYVHSVEGFEQPPELKRKKRRQIQPPQQE